MSGLPLRPRGAHHLAIQVVDLQAVERFYVQVLGLVVTRRWPGAAGSGDRSVWIELSDESFLALERVSGPVAEDDPHRSGLHLIALGIAVQQRDAWLERFAACGVPLERASPYTLYVRDPEGNRVGLSHWPHPAAESAD